MNLKSKNVFVTGADGFIGSHLVELLVKRGANVRALSQYNSFNNWGWLEDIDCKNDVEVVCGDIRDAHCVKKFSEKADVIFHLAALIAIPYSYVAPDSYVDTNVKGTLNVCQAALENGVSKVVHTSTSEVYGTAKYVPIDEKHPIQPQSPYSATKIGADCIAESFHRAFGLPLATARPFNAYGPRQSARAVIPSIITQLASGRKQIELGDTTPTRDFNFVKDTSAGFVAIAEADSTIGEVVNIATNCEISIADTFAVINEIMGANAEIVRDPKRIRPKNSEVNRLWGDNAKIKSLTDFSPKYDIRKGLAETVEWFSKPENLAKYKADIYNI